MKTEEYRLLESLLAKLGTELGHNYCIVPNQVQDGFYIGLFNSNGDRIKEIASYSIEHCVAKSKLGYDEKKEKAEFKLVD